MASAGLKRPSDFELNTSPGANSCWSNANKRRCTSFALQPQQANMSLGSSSSSSTTLPFSNVNNNLTSSPNQHVQNTGQHYQAHHSSSPSALSCSPFKDPSVMIGAIGDDVTSLIKNEVHRAHNQNQPLSHTQSNQPHNHQHQHHSHHRHQQQQQQQQQNYDLPVLSIRQTQMICEKIIRDREQRLRDEYDKILNNKLAEQHDTFVKYVHDHVEKSYNDTNSHQASYLS